MLSGNPNRLSTGDPSSTHLVISSKKHNKFVRHDLLLGTHAEKAFLSPNIFLILFKLLMLNSLAYNLNEKELISNTG